MTSMLSRLLKLANSLDTKGLHTEAEAVDAIVAYAGEEHGGKPQKVVDIAKSIREENPDMSDSEAYQIAWSQYKESKASGNFARFAKEPDKPEKVTEIADAIRRDNPDFSDEKAYRMAWETYCSYVNPGYDGCTSKGKSKRKSPKSEYGD